MARENVGVADGDAVAVTDIVEILMLATTNNKQMQLIDMLLMAFEKASCCVLGTTPGSCIYLGMHCLCTVLHVGVVQCVSACGGSSA